LRNAGQAWSDRFRRSMRGPRACWSNGCSGLQASWPSTKPFAVNLIVHKTSARLEEDLALCVKYRAWAVITSLGANTEVRDAIHSWGGRRVTRDLDHEARQLADAPGLIERVLTFPKPTLS
jgi:NAD(P)H-dependent flavin oxidoreductase YrpB (nitropropane dioxygenase family)